MVGSEPGHWLASQVHSLRNGTAALLAGNSVTWRLLPEAMGRRLVNLLNVALDGLAGALVGAAITLTLADLRLLGIAFDTGLYLYLVSQLLPRFLPDGPPAGPLLGSDRFAFAASVAVLCLGFPVSMLVSVPFSTSPLAALSSATGLSFTEPTTAQFVQSTLYGLMPRC